MSGRAVLRKIRVSAMRAGLGSVVAIACLLGDGAPAQAAYVTIPLNFETLTPDTTNFNANTANTTITNFAQNIVNTNLPGATIKITGAAASNSYTADGHVVNGPSTWVPNGNTSYTLANELGQKNGATYNGTFLMTSLPFSSSGSTAITIDLTGIYAQSISFYYEIFPDISCPSYNNCGTNHANLPDLSVNINGNATPIWSASGLTPIAPYKNSPDGSPEAAPQLIGFESIVLNQNVTQITFNDWPAAIAINNLLITTNKRKAPEPGSLAVLMSGLVGLAVLRRRRVS
jgi:hypothetical protein